MGEREALFSEFSRLLIELYEMDEKFEKFSCKQLFCPVIDDLVEAKERFVEALLASDAEQ